MLKLINEKEGELFNQIFFQSTSEYCAFIALQDFFFMHVQEVSFRIQIKPSFFLCDGPIQLSA